MRSATAGGRKRKNRARLSRHDFKVCFYRERKKSRKTFALRFQGLYLARLQELEGRKTLMPELGAGGKKSARAFLCPLKDKKEKDKCHGGRSHENIVTKCKPTFYSFISATGFNTFKVSPAQTFFASSIIRETLARLNPSPNSSSLLLVHSAFPLFYFSPLLARGIPYDYAALTCSFSMSKKKRKSEPHDATVPLRKKSRGSWASAQCALAGSSNKKGRWAKLKIDCNLPLSFLSQWMIDPGSNWNIVEKKLQPVCDKSI